MALFHKNHHAGLTLAEILVVLVLLAIVATFTIPKVLSNRANQQHGTLLVEVTGALNQTAVMAIGANQAGTGAALTAYLKDHINAVQVCDNATTDGCWFGFANPNAGAIVMTNGVVIADLDGYWGGSPPGTRVYSIAIDVNGPAGPNQLGEDSYWVVMNLGQQPYNHPLGVVKANGGVSIRASGNLIDFGALR